MVCDDTNMILSGIDPEFIGDDIRTRRWARSCTAGQELAAARHRSWPPRAPSSPTDDLISALVNANIDGEQLTSAGARRRSSSCWWWPATRPPATPSRTACSCSPTTPTSASCCWPTSSGRLGGAVEEIVRLGLAGDLHAPHADPGLRDERPRLPRGRQGRCCSTGRPTTTRPCSRTRPGSTSPARPTRTSASAAAGPHFCLGAHLARREITRDVPRAAAAGCRTSTPLGQPDRLLLQLHQRHQAPGLRFHPLT